MPDRPHHTHAYERLTPDVILSAVETYGLQCSGVLLPLNSYENRVYRVDSETGERVAVKFYRPGRWSNDAILEEHAFSMELSEHEIPVVAPLCHEGKTLNEYEGFRFAVFPWQPGRAPELRDNADRELLGRYLGRLHRLGAARDFRHRPTLTVQSFGQDSVTYLLEHDFIPSYLRTTYESIVELLLAQIDTLFRNLNQTALLRLHGDCHLSNLLWTENGAHIVDLDDCCTGPAVQDLWMLLFGDYQEMQAQLEPLLQGYTQFQPFNSSELALIEPLRTLRMLRYSAWLAQRWDDPAFPRNFPWFNTQKYWEEHILALREQQALLNEPPLQWLP